MTQVKKDFIGMFDVAKGILMFLIITIHTVHFAYDMAPESGLLHFGENFYRFETIEVGMFFVIAGYSFRPARRLKEYLHKQLRYFLLPYLICFLIILAGIGVRQLVIGKFIPGEFTGTFLSALLVNVNPYQLFGKFWIGGVVALWFPVAFFLSDFCYQLLWKIKHEKLRFFLIWGIPALCVLIPKEVSSRIPWVLVPSLTVLGLIETGRLLKKYKILYQKLRVFPILLIMTALLLAHLFSAANITQNHYQFLWLDYGITILSCIVLLQFYMKTGLAAAGFMEPFAFIGRYSIEILCIHGCELLLIPWNQTMQPLFHGALPAWVVFLLILFARVLLILLCCLGYHNLRMLIHRRKLERKMKNE